MRMISGLMAATACLLVPVTPGLAQDASGNAGDIIVTARKRQESTLKVPVIETVLSAEQLDRRQVATLSAVASLTPGVVLGQSALSVGTQVSIRGIGTIALDPGIDQSVSLNLDGLQVSQGLAYSVGVFDMAQVEVLKGPQALFFGKSSPGGVISIRTADPGEELEMIGRLGYEGEAREWRGEAILSTPLTDTLGVRIATQYSDFSGFFKNTAVAVPGTGAVDPVDRFGQQTSLLIRGTALFKPTPDFDVRLKLNYARQRQRGGAGFQLVSCPQGLLDYAGIPFFNPDDQCKADGKLNIVDLDPAAFGGLRNNGVPFSWITQKFGTLEWNYSLRPDLIFTSVTGYYDLKSDGMFNATVSGNAGPLIVADNRFRRKEFTQESRLNSDFTSPVNFTVGVFYQDGGIENDVTIAGNTSYGFLGPRLAVGSHDVDIKSVSIFGQLRYKPMPELEIAGGVRWTDEKRTNDLETVDLFGEFTGVPGSIVNPVAPKLSTKNWSPELTITYTPTDDLTLFGSLKQGYKSGSYNIVQPAIPGEDNSFGDEKVQGGEIGLKTRLADRQINMNVAGYYYNYSGLQQGANEVPQSGLPVVRTLNAGSAKVYGVDFDISYRPRAVRGLNLRSAINWNRARFTSFPGAPCWGGQTIADGCDTVFNEATGLFQGQDLKGVPLPRAPSWQLNAGFDYEMPLGDETTLKFGAEGQYSSKYLQNLGRRADFYQPKYARINANVSLSGPDDGWEVAFIGNNLTNRLVSGFCGTVNYGGGGIIPGRVSGGPSAGSNGIDEFHCVFDRGRELWLRLTLRPASL